MKMIITKPCSRVVRDVCAAIREPGVSERQWSRWRS